VSKIEVAASYKAIPSGQAALAEQLLIFGTKAENAKTSL
jgi:hypothetical protein